MKSIMNYTVVLFLVVVVLVIVIVLMFAGDAIGTGETIRQADKAANKAAVKECRTVCYLAFGPDGEFANSEHLQECYKICGQ